MANTLTYCSATKLAYRWGRRTRAVKHSQKKKTTEDFGLQQYKRIQEKRKVLTGEKLEHRRCHGNSSRDVSELDDKSRKKLDHDIRHLHRAHCKGHHTLLGTAVNEPSLEALNQFSLHVSMKG